MHANRSALSCTCPCSLVCFHIVQLSVAVFLLQLHCNRSANANSLHEHRGDAVPGWYKNMSGPGRRTLPPARALPLALPIQPRPAASSKKKAASSKQPGVQLSEPSTSLQNISAHSMTGQHQVLALYMHAAHLYHANYRFKVCLKAVSVLHCTQDSQSTTIAECPVCAVWALAGFLSSEAFSLQCQH